MPAEDKEMQRRHSSVTESATNSGSEFPGLKRQTSHENVELIPTRTTKVATSKPAANPLQFIKVGPCNLYRSAQEQLKKVDEVKKAKKEVRDEAEEWQSNLDNWKCSRRKKQEHIIERVVEVKKLELEEYDRNRRRSKTFSEMMEERNTRGRKLSLPMYQDDNDDLSELGISKCSSSRSNSIVEEEIEHNGKDGEMSQDESSYTRFNQNGTNGHKEEESLSRASSEVEEYTYERAIQSYVNFTETRVKSRNNSSSRSSPEENGCNGTSEHFTKKSPPVPTKPRRGSTTKIDEKLCEFDQLKKRSMSTTDLTATDPNKKPVVVPKVDINKRRELFEKTTDQEDQASKANRLSGDFTNSKSIRERLSSLGKSTEETSTSVKKKVDRVSGEISVKDRLSSIEKHHQSTENINGVTKVNRLASESLLNSQSVRERLNSLEKSANKESAKQGVSTLPNRITEDDETKPLKSLECSSETMKKSAIESFDQNASCDSTSLKESHPDDNFKPEGVQRFERTSSPEEEIYESKRQQHFRHRSLDSLDVDSNSGLGNECFERVQSLEDLDFCRNYPASSLSGDTDREDSGIHTADVSSSVSQADDCDSHLDSSSVDTEFKFQHQPTIEEEMTRQPLLEIPPTQLTASAGEPSDLPDRQTVSCVVEDSQVMVVSSSTSLSASATSCATSISASHLKLPLRTDHTDPLPVIPECPSEPITPSDIFVSLVNSDEIESVITCDADVVSETKPENNHINNSVAQEETVASAVNDNKDSNSLGINNVDNIDLVSNTVTNIDEPVSVYTNINVLDSEAVAKQTVVDSSTSLSSTNCTNTGLENGDDAPVVCMRAPKQAETSSADSAARRQTVIEICEKIDSSELASPLATPVISVNDFSFDSKEKTVKEDFAITQKEVKENDIISLDEALCRKENAGLCLNSDSVVSDKIEIYNDIEECKRVANTYTAGIDLVQPILTVKKDELKGDFEAIPKPSSQPIVIPEERKTFFLEKNINQKSLPKGILKKHSKYVTTEMN